MKKLIGTIAITAATLTGTLGFVGQTAADAYVGESKAISYSYAKGTAKLTKFPKGKATATVTIKRGSTNGCVYVQAAPYAVLALDGGWKTVPGSRTCGSATATYNDSFHLAYNGVKFRVCKDVNNAVDPCGSVVRIKG